MMIDQRQDESPVTENPSTTAPHFPDPDTALPPAHDHKAIHNSHHHSSSVASDSSAPVVAPGVEQERHREQQHNQPAQDPEVTMTAEGEFASTTLAERTLVESGHGHDVEEVGKTHTRGLSNGSLALPSAPGGAENGHARPGDSGGSIEERLPIPPSPSTKPSWDPLHTNHEAATGITEEEKEGRQDNTMIMDEDDDDVGDKDKPLYFSRDDDDYDDSDVEKGLSVPGGIGIKPSPMGSRKTSHLRLDLSTTKNAAATPWDQIDPPQVNNGKAMGDYYDSTKSQQKFRTLQSGQPRQMIPKSSYYFGPPGPDSAYGTAPAGQIGVHHPREILRVERDYTGGELIQFTAIYPLELEGRISPTQFLESINAINELLISAHSMRQTFVDNALAIFTLQISKIFKTSHFEKEMQRLRTLVDNLNAELYNPVGLNLLWPRNVAFLYLEIEYY